MFTANNNANVYGFSACKNENKGKHFGGAAGASLIISSVINIDLFMAATGCRHEIAANSLDSICQ